MSKHSFSYTDDNSQSIQFHSDRLIYELFPGDDNFKCFYNLFYGPSLTDLLFYHVNNFLTLSSILNVMCRQSFCNVERLRYFCHLCSVLRISSVVDLIRKCCSLVISFLHTTLCWWISLFEKLLSVCFAFVGLSSVEAGNIYTCVDV